MPMLHCESSCELHTQTPSANSPPGLVCALLFVGFANGIGALGNYEVRFTASLDMERTYLQAVMTYNSENPSVPISILTKFCGASRPPPPGWCTILVNEHSRAQ